MTPVYELEKVPRNDSPSDLSVSGQDRHVQQVNKQLVAHLLAILLNSIGVPQSLGCPGLLSPLKVGRVRAKVDISI